MQFMFSRRPDYSTARLPSGPTPLGRRQSGKGPQSPLSQSPTEAIEPALSAR